METNTDGNGQSSSGANYEGQAGNAERKRHDLGRIYSDRRMERNGGARDARQVQQSGSSIGYGGIEGNTESIGAEPVVFDKVQEIIALGQGKETEKTVDCEQGDIANGTGEETQTAD